MKRQKVFYVKSNGQIDIEFVNADISDVEKKVKEGISLLTDLLLNEYHKRHFEENKDLDKIPKKLND